MMHPGAGSSDFVLDVYGVLKKEATSVTLATEVNKLFMEEADLLPSQCSSHSHTKQARDPTKFLVVFATTKLEGGDFGVLSTLHVSPLLIRMRSHWIQTPTSSHISTLSLKAPFMSPKGSGIPGQALCLMYSSPNINTDPCIQS